MNFLNNIVRDFRDKKLWPVALVLVAALVAIPVLLSKSSSTPTTVGQAPPATAPPSTALPAVSVQTAPSTSRLRGKARNPFLQEGGGAATTTTTTTSGTTSTGSTTSGSTGSTSSTTGGSSTGGSAPSSSPQSTGTTTPTTIPTKPSKPAPTGLTAEESYAVTLAITNPSGGLNTINSLERLSVLPSENRPLLVELGVLKGGSRVLFAVQRGTLVRGPGTCTPGPIDCEILSLGKNQTESVSTRGGSGVSPAALFAITGIGVNHYPSAAAADKARRTRSAAGRALLAKSTLPSLSLFPYEPSLGTVVDLRNLTVGDTNGS